MSASVRNGITLICVTLNDRNDWQDHEVLYDYGFGQLSPQEVTFPADWTLPVTGGTTGTAAVAPAETLTVGVKDGNTVSYTHLQGKTGCPAANFSANHILTFCKRFNETGKATHFRCFFCFKNLEKIFEKPLTNRSEWCIIIYVDERCDAEKKMMEA